MNTSSSAHHVPSQLYTSTIASFQQGNIISSMILNTTCFYFPLHLTMKNSLYPDNNSSPLTIFILFTGWKRECYKPLWYVSCVFQYGVLHSRVYVLYVNHSLPSTCIQFLEVNPYSVVELYQKNQNTPSLFTVSFLRMRWRSFVTKLTWHERLPIKVSSITLLQHRSFCVHPCVIK